MTCSLRKIRTFFSHSTCPFNQRTLTYGKVSLYTWPPVCFVRIQLLGLTLIRNSITCLVKSKPVKQEVGRTVIQRSAVRIQSLAKIYLYWIFVYCQLCIENTKINKKRPGMAHIFLNIMHCADYWVALLLKWSMVSLFLTQVCTCNIFLFS